MITQEKKLLWAAEFHIFTLLLGEKIHSFFDRFEELLGGMREAAQEPIEDNQLVRLLSALPDAMVGSMRFNDTLAVVKLKTNLLMLELQHNKNFLKGHAMLVKEATDAHASAMWLTNGRAGVSSSLSTPICSNCNIPGHTFALCQKRGGGSEGKAQQ